MSITNSLIDHGPPALTKLAVLYGGYCMARQRFRAPFARILDELPAFDRQPPSERQAWQLERLRALLALAQERAPFYGPRLAALGPGASGLETLEDLAQIPALSKDEIRANLEKMLVREYRGAIFKGKTSGTTGEPLAFVIPWQLKWPINTAHLYHIYSWHGFGPRDRRVTLGGRYLGRREAGVIAYNPFERQMLLGSHALGPKAVLRYIRAMERFGPRAIQGHPSAIVRLIEMAQEMGLALPSIPCVFVTAETLELPQKEAITEALGARVVSTYGMGELALMAGQCEALEGFHIDERYGYVELLAHPSGLFEIVATSLLNDAMPLIRYRTGDLTSGFADELCSCGRTLRRLRDVIGRVDEVITDTQGQAVLPMQLRTDIREHVAGAPAYTIIQTTTPGQYRLILYADAPPPSRIVDNLHQRLQTWLGADAIISVEMTAKSQLLTAGGKHRIVIREKPARP